MTDQRSPEAKAYRALYNTRAWQVTRRLQLSQQPLCVMCKAEDRITAASVVDHIKPHKGDRVLFFEPSNLQSLCAPCHDRHKQSEDRTGKSKPVIGLDGWPIERA